LTEALKVDSGQASKNLLFTIFICLLVIA